MIAAITYFVSEAASSLWRRRRSTLLSVLTIASALFVLGLFLVMLANVERMVREWRDAAEFSVYLSDGATDADRRAIQTVLRADSAVVTVDSVSPADAARRFSRDFPSMAGAAAALPANPFPGSLEVRTRPGTDTGALDRIAARVRRMPGVSDVRYDREWLDRLIAITALARGFGLSLSGILGLAAVMTVVNVIRLAMHARRDEIEIMALVGAPIAFIRGPFILEGLLQGGAGAMIGLAALWIVGRFAGATIGDAGIPGSALGLLSGGTMAAMFAGSIVVGALAGLAATWRVVDLPRA